MEKKWIKWNGGECPVMPDVLVEVVLRCEQENAPNKAGEYDWKHLPDYDYRYDSDIVAYRVAD